MQTDCLNAADLHQLTVAIKGAAVLTYGGLMAICAVLLFRKTK